MKEELEHFLMKKLSRDLDIVQEKISQADANVREQIEVEEYQRLVCSFRPLLITNSTDLVQEFQNLSGPTAHVPHPVRLQQLRYAKLNSLEQGVSYLHNKVDIEKNDTKLQLQEYYKMISQLF